MQSAPGISIKEIFERAPDAALRDIVGQATIGVLSVMNPELLTRANLIELALQSAEPWGMLRDRVARDRILALLPAVKAGELADKLGLLAKGAKVYTDEAHAYAWMYKQDYAHALITHSLGEYVRGDISTNSIEGAFSQPGAKTVIPAKVNGKFSIRTVPNMELEDVDKLVFKHVNEAFKKLGHKVRIGQPSQKRIGERTRYAGLSGEIVDLLGPLARDQIEQGLRRS